MVTNMKPKVISKQPFSSKQIAAALAAAPANVADDPDSPRSKRGEWDNAVVSHSLDDLRTKLAARRPRGPNKLPTKEQVAVRYSPDVLAAFRASGRGWQTRMDEALRDWLKTHRPFSG